MIKIVMFVDRIEQDSQTGWTVEMSGFMNGRLGNRTELSLKGSGDLPEWARPMAAMTVTVEQVK